MAKKFSFPVEDDQFQTSSYTHKGGIINRCVMVATTDKGRAIRDTKDTKKNKTTLFFNPEEWDAFIKGVKNGEFD